jgi:hypothetical protein
MSSVNSERRSFLSPGRLASVAALSALAFAGQAAPSLAATTPPDASANYAFQTLNDNRDTTFNQLLGINNSGVIAGYFGSGQTGHPNRGYVLTQPYGQGSYHNENFPGSAQTQVTGINGIRDTVGFWVDGNGANHGFYEMRGHKAKSVNFPTNDNAKPQFDQLLGINTAGVTVGFYNDSKGTPHGFMYTIGTHRFKTVNVAGDTGITATAINNENDVAGIATNSAGTTEGFLKRSDGKVFHLAVPGATTTQAFGVNDGDEVVGDYTVGTGSSAMTFGFVWAPGFGFETVNDPQGVGSTTINGVNDRGTLVGFYTDSAGNTDGMLAHAQP